MRLLRSFELSPRILHRLVILSVTLRKIPENGWAIVGLPAYRCLPQEQTL
jgi:hypothetical protein